MPFKYGVCGHVNLPSRAARAGIRKAPSQEKCKGKANTSIYRARNDRLG